MKCCSGQVVEEGQLLEVRMFGSIEVVDGSRVLGARGFGCLKAKQVFEILLAERGRSVSKERLADLLWGERLPQKYVATVESYVSVLRSRLEPGRAGRGSVVVTEPGAYRLATGLMRLDLDVFDELVARAGGEQPAAALVLLCQAADLARGEVLADEPYADWVQSLREEYRRRLVGVLVQAAELALELGEAGRASALAERAIRVDEVAEAAYRVLMLASYRVGRQEEAVRAFERCRKALESELGVEPMGETVALYAAVQAHDVTSLGSARPGRTAGFSGPVAVAGPVGAGPVGGGPVGGGLVGGGLVGRAGQLAQLESEVRAGLSGRFSLLLIEGDAGIGKSRLVDELAGRLAGVRKVRWRCSPLESGFEFLAIACALRGLEEEAGTAALGWGTGPAGALSLLDDLAVQVQRHAPFVVLLDRLDLADPGSVSVLGHLARRLVDVPVVVVATCRTPAANRPPISRLEWAARIRLERLTADELVDYQVPDLHARTGGHPMFVAAHLEGPGIDGSVELSRRVLAWCADAGDTATRTLSAASVLPQPFSPSLLGQVLNLDVVNLAEELDRLCQHGLLQEHGPDFAFRDDQVRQILHNNLSAGRRALLHALAQRAQTPTTHHTNQTRIHPTNIQTQQEAS
jgi:DNA-binding SARP family transcriptional activator